MADLNRRTRGGMNQRDFKNVNKGGNRIEFRFLIPSKAASIIIGKGGERIQRLRHECNARLSIPDNHGPERVFILESTMDSCVKIWRDCMPELKEFMFPSNMEARRAGGSFRDDGPDMDLRFLVHDSQVGAIIGKGGVNVKNLRLQYQLNIIKVFPVTAPFSSDRLVQMVGKFDKVFDCFRVIYDILEGQVIKGLVENYNSANFDENLSLGYGGWSNQSGSDAGRKGGQGLMGGPGGDRIPPQNSRFSNSSNNNNSNNNINNNNRPNDQFFPKPDMNRNSTMPPKPPMNRFENFNEPAPDYEMDSDNNFQMPFNSKMPPMPAGEQQGFPGMMRKRNNNSNNSMDMEPENVKRGRMGMHNNPNVFEPRSDKMMMNNPFDHRIEKPDFFDNRNEKPDFFDNRNDKPDFFDNRNDKPDFFDNRNEKSDFFDNRNEKPNFYENRNEKPNFFENRVEKPNLYDNRNEKPNFFDNRIEKPNLYDNRNEKPNFYDNRNEKPNFYDNRNEKPNFYESKMLAPSRNELMSSNPMMNMNMPPNSISNNNSLMMDSGNVAPNPLSTEMVEVSVPTTLIHAVSGLTGAEALSSIINDSGAEICINATEEHDFETIVSLTGTKDQIEGAQYLLQICIKKSVLNL